MILTERITKFIKDHKMSSNETKDLLAIDGLTALEYMNDPDYRNNFEFVLSVYESDELKKIISGIVSLAAMITEELSKRKLK